MKMKEVKITQVHFGSMKLNELLQNYIQSKTTGRSDHANLRHLRESK